MKKLIVVGIGFIDSQVNDLRSEDGHSICIFNFKELSGLRAD